MSDSESEAGSQSGDIERSNMTLVEFKETSQKYIDLQDLIAQKKKEIKDLSTTAKTLDARIQEFMINNDYECCNVGDRTIELLSKERATPLGQKKTEECFVTFFKSTDKAKELSEFLKAQRVIKQSYSLKTN